MKNFVIATVSVFALISAANALDAPEKNKEERAPHAMEKSTESVMVPSIMLTIMLTNIMLTISTMVIICMRVVH